MNLGLGGTEGGFGAVLEKAETGEFGIVRSAGRWRFGLGANFGSFLMKPPYDREPEWGFQRIFVSGTRTFSAWGSLRPYLQGSLGIVRLHPRSELFAPDSLPADFKIGDSPTRASNGFHLGIAPGVEWPVSPAMAVDLSLLLDYYRVGRTDLSPVGGGSATSGFDWQPRAGVVWWNGAGGEASGREPDAWGIRPSYGWGFGEALGINFGASAFNEYVRNANFNQVSLRSWRQNATHGFTYDDNKFTTNQFIHPFNGSQYYNAGRSNGLSFWPSYAVALTAALHWELAGETHPMSFNDLISTGIGGAAVGETQFRFSSMMLDNSATGARRFFREAAAMAVDPIRGFNRLVSGRAWQVRPNPTDRIHTNPIGQQNQLDAGWRVVGDGPSLKHDTSQYGFLRYLHEHGDVFVRHRRPFEFFTFDGRLNFGDKNTIGRLVIAGHWLTVPLGDAEPRRHRIAITQHFEYIDNSAFEYGGQSIGAAFLSRWGAVGPLALETRFDLLGTVLGAVNSEYAALAQVADPERYREYDYGPGAGSRAEVRINYRRRPLLTASHGLHFLHVTNGSIYHKDNAAGLGLDATHWLHRIDLRLDAPAFHDVGLGIEYNQFTRQTHYKITLAEITAIDPTIAISQFITQSTPEVRVYLRYCPSPPS